MQDRFHGILWGLFLSYACGRTIQRDANFTSAENSPEEFPWTVGIYQRTENGIVNACGGTLISEKLILTAAHCVSSQEGEAFPSENYIVAAGALHKRYRDPRDEKVQYADVARIINQHRYRGTGSAYANDIAVLVTKQKFAFNDFIQPVCIIGEDEIELKSGDIGIVIGFGIIKPGNDLPDKLKLLEIPYKPEATCLDELPQDWRKQYYTPDKLCAGLYNQSMSICVGDGGAGLTYKNPQNQKYYVHGVVSVGHAIEGKCNIQQNSLYTNVKFHSDFIHRQLNDLLKECVLPPYPENGKWTVENEHKKPGDVVSSDTFLSVSCNSAYKLSNDKATIKCDLSYLMPSCEKLCPAKTKSSVIVQCFDKNQKRIECDEAVDGSILTYSMPTAS
ncbi:hypothetical protein NQ318_009085 [Aromia moschata]|uniref:Peptidase S1 domain-containing protein n=1 Tax=Aromia moschata TaxID=1265417 RepID=A0AAV8YVM9_9CUCU|nr:hypothetical protein NQ318_009085 [Aromia moschata]